MVVAAHPLAAAAGREVLRAGGGAVDAAIAVQMVLTLVEPQSSGIGGGGFLLHFDAGTGKTIAYDGRETAPAAAQAAMFLDGAGAPRAFDDVVVGGLSVGVPGLLRMLEMAHRDHGRLPWAKLFQPAILAAENGFPVSPRLHGLIAADKHLATQEQARRYFFSPDGAPLATGSVLVNRPLADALRRIADGGADAFYEGTIARDIVRAVRTAPRNPSVMRESDLAGYVAKRRDAVCLPYRKWEVCGMPPPSSGGLATLQILGLVERFDLARLAPSSLLRIHLIAEASRLAFADRNLYVADPDFVPVPVAGLLDAAYLAERSGAISPHSSLGRAEPGRPAGAVVHGEPVEERLRHSTSHLSVVDAEGNAVAMTSSIEDAFGSRLMVHGFLLNNQLTDFSFLPHDGGNAIANRVEAGKRPRSSMAPTLVFSREGRLAASLGSPGGSRIIGYVSKALIAVLDGGLGIQEAISLPNFVNRNGPTELEAGTHVVAARADLERLGHQVVVNELVSGLHGIVVTSAGLEGGADPRREGVAIGD
jgi:gamma-glutamyltranspeptidase/glutathione hydrolase